MPKLPLTCPQCGSRFEAWPSQARRFCSQSCRSRYGAIHGNMPTKPRRGTTKPCGACGTPVYRRAADTGDRFCSIACHNVHQARNQVRLICERCGKNFRLAPSQAAFQTGRFCSKACESTSRQKRPLDRTHNGKPALLDLSGYVKVWEPTHPRAFGGWVFEHRILMERALGRQLAQKEHVHHLNGVKDDNRLENLQVLSHSEHSRITGNERRRAAEAMQAELAEYRRRHGPLT